MCDHAIARTTWTTTDTSNIMSCNALNSGISFCSFDLRAAPVSKGEGLRWFVGISCQPSAGALPIFFGPSQAHTCR